MGLTTPQWPARGQIVTHSCIIGGLEVRAHGGVADGAALLRKPFSPVELLAAVAKALDRSP